MWSLPLRKYWQPLARKWDELHVERHGMYSVERMYRFKVFCERTSLIRAVTVIVLTPLPCFVVAVAVDMLPLEPPETGLAHSALFWIRLLLVSWLILFAILKQCRRFVVGVPMRLRDIALASLFVASGAAASTLWLASRMGFPLPFTIALESPFALVLLLVALSVLWGKYLPRNRSLQLDLLKCMLVISTQLTLTYVYPAYNFVFGKLGAYPQVVFALLLPAMKITAKNWMSFLLQRVEDLKPEFIIFNVEVFHALFVSSCMQSVASMTTTAIIMGTDFMFGTLALRRILKTIRKFHSSVNPANRGSADPAADAAEQHARAMQWDRIHFLDVAIFLLETNPVMLRSRNMRLHAQGSIPKISQIQPSNATTASAATRGAHSSAINDTSAADVSTRSSRAIQSVSSFVQEASSIHESDAGVKGHDVQSPTLSQLQTMMRPSLHKLHQVRALLDMVALGATLTNDDKRLVASLDTQDRLRYVEHVLQLLFCVEFILLVEFTEVVVPIVYSAYLFVIFHLPNKQYHAQLRDLDLAALQSDISRIVVYALLELFTLLCMLAMLQRKLKYSTVRQLAFVLQSQWAEVQAKLILWCVYTLQNTVVHYGVDFTFQFAWIDRAAVTKSGGGSGGSGGA